MCYAYYAVLDAVFFLSPLSSCALLLLFGEFGNTFFYYYYLQSVHFRRGICIMYSVSNDDVDGWEKGEILLLLLFFWRARVKIWLCVREKMCQFI